MTVLSLSTSGRMCISGRLSSGNYTFNKVKCIEKMALWSENDFSEQTDF